MIYMLANTCIEYIFINHMQYKIILGEIKTNTFFKCEHAYNLFVLKGPMAFIISVPQQITQFNHIWLKFSEIIFDM